MSRRRRKADCTRKMAYHDILDKGYARDGALYARKDKSSAWWPCNGCRRWRVHLRHANGWDRGGVRRSWGSKRPGKCSKTSRTRRRGFVSAVLRFVAGQTNHSTDACIAVLVEAGRSRSRRRSMVVQDSSVQRQGLTNVKQHNLGRAPSFTIKRRGRHVVGWLLSRGR
jgi:hypothetical protein